MCFLVPLIRKGCLLYRIFHSPLMNIFHKTEPAIFNVYENIASERFSHVFIWKQISAHAQGDADCEACFITINKLQRNRGCFLPMQAVLP